jgi:hypothetical protein
MPSPPSWLLSWLLNDVARSGDAGTEPPNFDFCCCYWKLAISCPILPAIMYDYITYLVWWHLSLQWCESVVEAVANLLRVMIPSTREWHSSSLMPTWGYFIIVSSKLSLVEFGRLTPPHFARSVFCSERQGRDQVYGLCWWKNTNRTKTLFTLL